MKFNKKWRYNIYMIIYIYQKIFLLKMSILQGINKNILFNIKQTTYDGRIIQTY